MIYSYRRVSTDEQHNGPQAQTDAIDRWMQLNGWADARCAAVLVDGRKSDYFDNGVSGSVPLGKRPEGAKLLAVLHPKDTVVTAKLDRLFRSVADAATTIEAWSRSDISLVAIAEGFNMNSLYGRAMAHMAAVFAELERGMISDRTKSALDAKRKRGECVGEVPFGMYRDPVSGLMLTHETEQGVIRLIKDYRDVGLGYEVIAKILNRLGKTAKKGGKWSKTQVQRVIDRVVMV